MWGVGSRGAGIRTGILSREKEEGYNGGKEREEGVEQVQD